jgi:hypothetical protein
MRALAILATIGFLFVLPAQTMAQVEEMVDMELAERGRVSYRFYCRTCHGESAEGDGPIAEQLRSLPADLTMLSQRNRGDFPTERIRQILEGQIEVKGHGSGDMPVWGDAFLKADESRTGETVEDRILALTHYLWSIQADGG